MHHPTDRIAHTTAFVTPVVDHWLERETAQWVHPMKDRSDDPGFNGVRAVRPESVAGGVLTLTEWHPATPLGHRVNHTLIAIVDVGLMVNSPKQNRVASYGGMYWG